MNVSPVTTCGHDFICRFLTDGCQARLLRLASAAIAIYFHADVPCESYSTSRTCTYCFKEYNRLSANETCTWMKDEMTNETIYRSRFCLCSYGLVFSISLVTVRSFQTDFQQVAYFPASATVQPVKFVAFEMHSHAWRGRVRPGSPQNVVIVMWSLCMTPLTSVTPVHCAHHSWTWPKSCFLADNRC